MQTTDFLEFAPKMLEAGIPFLVEGEPGMGKTDMLKLSCANIGYDCIVFLLGLKSPVDVAGVPAEVRPANGKKPAEWDFVPIGDLRRVVNATKPTVVVMDDFGQGVTATQNAASHFIQSRQVGETKISDHVRICGTTNTTAHKSGANPILENVKSRWGTIIHLEKDLDGWLKWASECADVGLMNRKEPFPAVVTAFQAWKGADLLYGFKPLPGLENSHQPRTIHNAAKCLVSGAVTDKIAYEVLKGAAGKPWTTEFLGFLKLWSHLPPVEDVLDNPDILDTMTFEKFQWDETAQAVVSAGQASISQRPDVAFSLVTSASEIVTAEQMDNYVHLLTKFQKPVETLGMILVRNRKEDHLETSAFVHWAANNQQLML